VLLAKGANVTLIAISEFSDNFLWWSWILALPNLSLDDNTSRLLGTDRAPRLVVDVVDLADRDERDGDVGALGCANIF